MSSESNVVVSVEGYTFSALEKPPRDCKAVVEELDSMLSPLKLDDILSSLVMVSKSIGIAYNAYGVAGDTELQITIRELGYEIAKLFDDSGLTIRKFRMTADSILTDLTGAYQFFLDDMREMAITSVESAGDSRKPMADAAQQLCDRFEAEKEKVRGVHRKTFKRIGILMKQQMLKDLEMRARAEGQAKVAQCTTKAVNLREQAISGLHAAVQGLSYARTIMQQVAAFWSSMQHKFKELQCDGRFTTMVNIFNKCEDPNKRLKVCQSRPFKRFMVNMYRPWVAMEVVCDKYIKETKDSMEELYSYLSETPTIEESKQHISQLSRVFQEKAQAREAEDEKKFMFTE